MTLLELVQLYATESESSYRPSDITTLSGQILEIDRWRRHIISAWVDIQGAHDWSWREHQVTLDLTASNQRYAPTSLKYALTAAAVSRFEKHLWPPRVQPRLYLTATGIGARRDLRYLDWASWTDLYQTNTAATQGPPAHVTEDPQGYLRFGPIPDDSYTYEGAIIEAPQLLDDEADEVDETIIPASHQDMIVYQAMTKHGMRLLAPEILEYASAQLAIRLAWLNSRSGKTITLGGPLA